MRRSVSFGRPLFTAAAITAMALSACGGGGAPAQPPPKTAAPPPPEPAIATTSATQREQPPPPSASKESPFPAVHRTKLANGLEVAVVEAHALPIVQLRVLVHAGMNYGPPAAAEITAQLLKDGGTRTLASADLLRKIETLGASLGVNVDMDATVLSLAVVKSHVDEALGILADVVEHPRFDETELGKLKSRETDATLAQMRSSGSWGAHFMLQRELYAATSPYAEADVLPSTIGKVTAATVRDFHRRFYVPKNVTLVVAGDVDAAAIDTAAERLFGSGGGWKGADPPKIDFPAAIAPTSRRVVVVHRAKSTQSDVFVTSLMPPRKSPEWPTLRVATHVFGGGVTGRLFLDIREQRSLAYSASAQIEELSHGDQPLIAYAGTQTPKTALAVQAILEDITRMQSDAPTAQETAIARRYLSDIFAVRMETLGSIADMVAVQSKLDLPDGYWDAFRGALKQVTDADARAAAAKLFHADRALVVVAGDADVIAPSLAHFGDVTVVDPTQEFKTMKTLPKNESAPLEIESAK